MNTKNALGLAHRFIELPLEKRKLFLEGLSREKLDFRVFPIPAGVIVPEREMLSYAQQRMWFLWQLDPESAAYNLPGAVRLYGRLNVAALEQAFAALVTRHETLRSTFHLRDEQPIRVIHEQIILELVQQDLRELSEVERTVQARLLSEAEAMRPFDLEHGPLLRLKLLRLAEQEHVLLVTLHHIVSDGWSMGVLIDEFSRLYQAYSEGRTAALAELPIQYSDYALWQRQWLEAGEMQRQLDYWTAHVGDEHPVLALPTDHARPPQPSYRGMRLEFSIDPVLAEQLRSLAQQQGITLFMLLLASFMLLLQRYTGQNDIRVGVPIANRNRAETEGLIGFFVNTQVLRCEFDGQMRFDELLQQVRQAALGAQAHQELPFEQLVEALQVERNLSYNPLFQALYNHQSMVADVEALTTGELKLSRQEWEGRTTQFDLSLDTLEKSGRLEAALTYAVDLFERSTAERMIGHWQNLLRGIVTNPRQRLAELPLLGDAEREQILHEWNQTQASYPSEQCIQQLIEAQAARTPNATAVVFGEQHLSYDQLNRQANRLAHKLREQGVGPDVLVGIAVERSLEMIVGLLAILKAGGAYVPLDPAYPKDRLAYMIEDSGIGLLLTQSPLLERLSIPGSVHSLCLDRMDEELSAYPDSNLENLAQPENLAYVIYTSGSTGQPKGTALRHNSFVNLLHWFQQRCELTAQDKVLLISSYSFDLTQKNLHGILCAGGQLHIPAGTTGYDPDAYRQQIAEHGITLINCAPSAFYPLLQGGHYAGLASLRHVLLGGEPISLAELSDWLSAPQSETVRLHNTYGPTECTDVVVAHTLENLTAYAGHSMPTGRPLPGVQTYILDNGGYPVAPGVIGELHIGGFCVGEGYWHKAGLTAERFIPDPFDDQGGRLYRTGDLARYRADGVIEYMGRIDHQVKIRGFRIELGEIEARLQQHLAVREAVVIDIDGSSGKQLAGYLVPSDPSVLASEERQLALRSELKEHLKTTLPDYMVPAHLILLERMSLTPNGKLDRKALPRPDISLLQQEYVAPQSELEQQLAGIWAQVLKVERVGLTDNFFELGGHSLLATQVISRTRHQLSLELSLRSLFESQDLADFAAAVAQSTHSQAPAFVRIDRNQPLGLSYAQQRQWFLWQLEPDSAAYHIPAALRLKGKLDLSALQSSFAALIQRHESLRTTFRQEGEQAVQIIRASLPVPLELETLSEATDEQIRVHVENEVAHLFDLERGPLLRVKLLRLGDDDHVLVLTLHHIVSDGWSTPIMVDELIQLYEGYSQGREIQLPDLPIQYADYAAWQREWMEAGERERQLAYWTEKLGGEQSILELPSDRPRPSVQSHRGVRLNLELDSQLTQALRGVAQRHNVTLFMLLLASFQTLLHRYSGQTDIRVGVPIANRTRMETEWLIGFFVNTQVLKAEFDLQLRFSDLLQQVRQTALEAQAHQDLPFEQLVEALQPERSLSHSPLFQVMFNHQAQVKGSSHKLPGLQIEGLDWEGHSAQFDLTLDTCEAETGISVSLSYATDLFDMATVKRMSRHWINLLQGIAQQPEQRLAELPLLGDAEREQILHEWNQTQASYPSEQCIHQLIEAQAARTPDATAVVFGEQHLSYDQLNRQANRLAHKLREQGVGPDVLVGIAVERSLEMIVGLLAILKAGGAYVPLDPAYPKDRLAYMIEDSGIGLLLTQSPLLERLSIPGSVHSLCLDRMDEELSAYPDSNLENLAQPENLAYVIYTSGSTGQPKGTALRHNSFVNLLHWFQQRCELTAQDKVLLISSYSFDLTQKNLHGILCAGGQLHIPAGTTGYDPDAYRQQIAEHGITLINCAPSAFYPLLQGGHYAGLASLRHVLLGGEPISLAELSDWLSAPQSETVRLHNTYGPTECTDVVVAHTLENLTAYAGHSMPTGRPLPGVQTYILDNGGYPVAPGVIGELHIGGFCVGEGYWHKAGLTAERFIPDPFDDQGGRLYRTGDLARYRADGVIEYMGRIDHQVKIRGFRIELGEIEARLQQHLAVREAVVIDIDGSSGKQLAGYLVPSDPSVLASEERQLALRSELKEHLKTTLPDYMVPAHLILLERMSLTPNGKLDRKALPRPDISLLQQEYVAPQSELEQQLAGIWAQVLKVERVGLTDNFFELGGDSIISIQVVSRARQLGIRFSARDLFLHQTVQMLARVAERSESPLIDQGLVMGMVPLTPVQLWFFEQPFEARDHWNQSLLLTPRHRLEASVLARTLAVLVRHHDALRLRFAVKNGVWSQTHAPITAEDYLWQGRTDDSEALNAFCERVQRSLSLQAGPMLRGALIEQADGSQRLLLVIHHLVVDGVSWRILLEDLQSVYKQLENAMPVELPSKSSSYQHWAQYLKKHVQMPVMQDELAWWQERLTGSPAELPRDNPAGSMQNHHSETVIIRLDAERTRQLLKDASAVYRTQVNDLLLTALARVFCRWSKTESILIQLEGHGREDLFDELDLTRTLGWFTSMFPVRLSPWADADADIAGSIKQIKEELRAIPSKGMSYGLLRYLGSTEAQATLAALPQPRITFNYLGQFDNQFDANTLFVPAQESSGCAQSEQDSLANWLSIEGEVYGGRLSLQWGYSREVYRRDTIERLAGEYQQELEALIAHCLSEEAGGATPSDFPLVSLTQEQLDALPIATTVVEDIYPLTPMQEGLLLHTLLEPHSGIYFMQDRYIIDSDIDLTRFTDAWRKVICRHDALRTSFNVDDQGRTLQIIHRKTELELEYWDWSEQLESEQEAALQTLLAEERRQGFDLLHKPPFRLYLIKRSPSRYWFILCNHHALLDAWCRSLLLEDFFAFYRGEYNLVPAPRYRDFIAWLQERGETAALSFWCEELRDVEQPTPLPFDRNARRHDGASVINDLMVRLPREQGKRLRELAQQQQLTVNTLAQAAWSLVLHRYSGNRDLLFGVTVAGRPASCPQMQYTVGLFINTIPLRVRLPDFGNRCSVRQWLQSLLEQNFVLREHEHLSLVKIHECSGLRKGQQLFDSLFVFESAPVERSVVSGAGQISAREDSARTHTNYPLTVVVYPDDELGLHLSYDQRFFDEATVERLLNDFKRLLEALVDGFEGDFASLPLLSVDEQHWLLEDCNRTGAEYPLGSGYVRLFEAQVAQGSSRVVARCLDRQWTYRDLNVHANRLGHALRAAGVSEDQPVALLAERGLELLGMIIGSFKAGAGYLPLDPHLPVQRLIDLLMLSHTPVLVCSVACVEQARSLLTNLPAIRLLVWDEVQQGNWLDTNLGIYVTGQHLGYVIYTSGSTGTPKGVMVEQAGMLNNQLSKVPYFGLIEKDVIAQTASQSFDISVWQFLAAPLFGGCVEIVPNAIAHDPVALLTHVQQSGISVLESVPSLIQGMLAEEKQELPSLRWMLPTGEAMPPELARQWLNRYPEVGLVNAYGPAECSDDVALHSVTQVCTGGSYLPIGTPTDNNRLYLLDDNLNPVPVGAIGELYVAGIGVGRGYLSDPKRSAEAFLPHLFGSEGARLYRTGDLVKRQVSGVLEYVGRVDHQVKIRGFRIELGEIEALLHEHPELADAAVAVQETSNGRQLVGYAVPISTKDNALPERLKQALKAKLPDYMVPLHWCLLEKLPRNVNGKLDRKALPALEIGQTQGEYVAPRNGLESTLAEIWRKVLKVERVGITDNFFELGGHSLLVVQVVTRIRNQFNIDLKAKDFFELPDLAALSQYIQREGAQANLVQDELTKSLEALKRLSAEEINELIS